MSDNQRPRGGSPSDPEHPPARSAPPARPGTGEESPLRRVLTTKVPLWLLLAAAAAIAMTLSTMLVVQQQTEIELGPAVGAAESVEVRITICNAEIDRLRINPRTAELDLEELLTGEGAAGADVTVDRRDCAEGASPTASTVP